MTKKTKLGLVIQVPRTPKDRLLWIQEKAKQVHTSTIGFDHVQVDREALDTNILFVELNAEAAKQGWKLVTQEELARTLPTQKELDRALAESEPAQRQQPLKVAKLTQQAIQSRLRLFDANQMVLGLKILRDFSFRTKKRLIEEAEKRHRKKARQGEERTSDDVARDALSKEVEAGRFRAVPPLGYNRFGDFNKKFEHRVELYLGSIGEGQNPSRMTRATRLTKAQGQNILRNIDTYIAAKPGSDMAPLTSRGKLVADKPEHHPAIFSYEEGARIRWWLMARGMLRVGGKHQGKKEPAGIGRLWVPQGDIPQGVVIERIPGKENVMVDPAEKGTALWDYRLYPKYNVQEIAKITHQGHLEVATYLDDSDFQNLEGWKEANKHRTRPIGERRASKTKLEYENKVRTALVELGATNENPVSLVRLAEHSGVARADDVVRRLQAKGEADQEQGHGHKGKWYLTESTPQLVAAAV